MNRKWISSAGVVHDHSESCCAGLCSIVRPKAQWHAAVPRDIALCVACCVISYPCSVRRQLPDVSGNVGPKRPVARVRSLQHSVGPNPFCVPDQTLTGKPETHLVSTFHVVFAVSRPVSHQTYQLFIEYDVWRQLLCKPQKRSASPSAGASPRSLHTDNQR